MLAKRPVSVITLSILTFLLCWHFQLLDKWNYTKFSFQHYRYKNNITYSIESTLENVLPSEKSKRKKLILYWTTAFQRPISAPTFQDCPFRDKCFTSSNRSLISKADAVVFHMIPGDFEWSDIPSSRHSNQLYVFMIKEAPPHRINAIDFNRISGFFNLTMTYRYDSDCPMPYGGWWIWPREVKGHSPDTYDIFHSPIDAQQVLAEKTDLVFWMVSNCVTPSKRELIVAELQKYIRVDIIGQCSRNKTLMHLCKRDVVKRKSYFFQQPPLYANRTIPCEENLFKKYKFYIALENSNCQYYVTEKYWARFAMNAIPIVGRRWIYQRYIPDNSFIAVDDFKNGRDLANYLKYLDGNATAYLDYFQWRTEGYARPLVNAQHYRWGQCNLCERLWASQKSVIGDMMAWYYYPDQCEMGEFASSWVEKKKNGS